MNTKRGLTIILLLILFNCYSQVDNIDFGNGNIQDITYHNVMKDFISDSIIPFSYNILQSKHRLSSLIPKFEKKQKDYLWNFKNKIQFICDGNYNIKEIITPHKTYNMKSLFKQCTNYSEKIPVTFLESSSIALGEKTYLITTTTFYSNLKTYNSLTLTFVFEIYNNKVTLLPFKSSSYSSKLCFGDFDNDLNLDYIYIEECESNIFTYKYNHVEKNNTLFLSLLCLNNSIEQEFIYINLAKSIWPTNLYKAWDNPKE